MKTSLVMAAVLCVFAVAGCNTSDSVYNHLESEINSVGYTLYRPFRTSDKPPTIFVFAVQPSGQATECTLQAAEQVYRLPWSQVVDDPDGQPVGAKLDLTREFSISPELGLEIIGVPVAARAKLTHEEEFHLKLGPQRKYVFSLARMQALRGRMAPEVRETIETMARLQQFGVPYMVIEAIEVDGVTASLRFRDEASASVAVTELKGVAKLEAKLSSQRKDEVTLSTDKTVLIGYKAIRLTNELMSSLVSPSEADVLAPGEIASLKRREAK